MAGEQIPLSPASTLLEGSILGLSSVSLTNYSTYAEPTVAAGSKVEVGGSLFNFSTDESISGWAAASTGRAYISASATATSTELVLSWTSTPPVWSTSKQGFYDSLEVNRYLGYVEKYGSTQWVGKAVYDNGGHLAAPSTVYSPSIERVVVGNSTVTEDISYPIKVANTREYTIEIGPWDMDTNGIRTLDISSTEQNGLFLLTNVIKIEAFIRSYNATSNRTLSVYPIEYPSISSTGATPSGYVYVGSRSQILLGRIQSAVWDTATYSGTTYNRGWVNVTIVDDSTVSPTTADILF